METALVSASQGAVRILLGKLGNVLATKYALLSGVRGEIQELKDELESMTGCLRDLAERDDHSQQTYDRRSLLKSVLKQLVVVPAQTPVNNHPLQGINNWGISRLLTEYRTQLSNKRYLVVLDDVWMPAAWEDLNMFFPENGRKSRIIVTTRSQHVARNCSTSSNDHMYEMKPLNTEDSKLLFFKTLFGSGQCPWKLRKVSTDILEKCKGLPLVIVSIGRMLAQRKNKTPAYWQKVCDRLGAELETNSTLEAVGRILTLSYNDLPYNLKACFLYLCAFPEDYEIKRGPLIRRWAAEGFIAAVRGLSLEQIGQNYFDEFIGRSLVIPGVLSDTGEVKSCKVHDIMLEVITSKSFHENFISFLGSSTSEDNIRAGHDKIRRLSIHPGGTRENRGFTSQYLTHTRSLTIIGSTTKPAAITFSRLTLLRVVDLEGCSWLRNEDCKDICKLSLLIYLSLRNTTISKVPNAVGKLKELVTLDVRETSVTEFPRGITKLQNLKHLLTGSYQYYTRTRSVKHLLTGVKLPRGLRNMCALQRISTIDINKSFRSMDELGDLSQLTRLYVVSHEEDEDRDTRSWEPFVKSLDKLSSSLRYLSFQRLRRPPRDIDEGQPRDVSAGPLDFLANLTSPPLFLHSLHLCGRVSLLPDWFSSLSNLASVSLRETYFIAELIGVLGQLPNLLSFKIYASGIQSTETRLCFEQGRFPRLKQLVLDNPSNISEEISFCGGASNLERLTLSIVNVPSRGISGIENLLKLREVEFFGSIVQSLVDTVMAVAREHPNHPRVNREDQPTEDQPTEAQPTEDQPTEAASSLQPTEDQPEDRSCLSILLAAVGRIPGGWRCC